MPSAMLIANPVARGFSSEKHRRAAAILRHAFDLSAAWPGSPAESRRVAADAAADGFDVVVAMGGDGIVHHVVQGIAGSDSHLGIIPVGTANVVARQLEIPIRLGASTKLIAGHNIRLPQPLVEIEGEAGGRPFRRRALFALGVGADASIVQAAEAEPLRKRGFGVAHYASTAIGVTRKDLARRGPELTVTTDGFAGKGIGVMAQFRVSYTYFGSTAMRLSPQRPDPMTLLLVEELRARRAPAIVKATIGKGGLERVRGFRVWTGVDEFEVDSENPAIAHADGEILGHFTNLRARFVPDAYTVIAPAPDSSAELPTGQLELGEGGGQPRPPS